MPRLLKQSRYALVVDYNIAHVFVNDRNSRVCIVSNRFLRFLVFTPFDRRYFRIVRSIEFVAQVKESRVLVSEIVQRAV